MKRLKSLVLTLLLFATLVAPLSASVGAAGPKANVDFTIEDITIGNASVVALQWDQADGTTIDYFLNSQTLPIQVTFKQAGSSLQSTAATGYIQVWHPVGVKVAEWNYSLSLSGGQSSTQEATWTANAAHSMLAENGSLAGGYIIRGVVDGGLLEGEPGNDAKDETVPIAIYYGDMERGYCGDFDGDSQSDCQGTTYYKPTFASVGYDPATGNVDGYGPWLLDNSSGYVGTKHWRHSVPLQDYVSNGNDDLVWGWLISSQDNCDDPGHGLGYGMIQQEIQALYGYAFCRIQLTGGNYISMQLATQAWGGMGSNDEVSLRATQGTGQNAMVISQKNLSTSGISGATNDWTPVVWDLTNDTGNQVFSLSYHFESDNSGATAGIHIDQFALFGIEKVQEYTVSVDCDNPETGYTVIPADPMPPSLHCYMTNNGYREHSLQLLANVSNYTWMNSFAPIRIDSNNLNDHDYSVPLNPLAYNETTEFWVNLSIPPGANVEQLIWDLNITDSYTGEIMHQISMPLSVAASYSVDVSYYGPGVALTLPPDEVGMVEFTLTNTGNQMAYWNLDAFFNRSEWGSSNIRFLDAEVNGSEISFMQLHKGQSEDFWAEFTAPTEISPGLTEVTILSSGQSPATAQNSRKINIEIPQVHDLTMVASEDSVTAYADMYTRTVEVELTNNGNAPERFDLEVTADWRLDASVSQPMTEEIGPFGDSTAIYVVMPMPYGIRPDTYFINLKATSQTDSTFFLTQQIELIVQPTYLINVEDVNMTGQTFQGGADPKTISFEVTNNGNDYDEFVIELDTPSGMNAQIIPSEQYDPAAPPSVEKGASVNVTIQYWFDTGTNGMLELVVSASSVQSGEISGASGSATFQVGTQGWIELTPGGIVNLNSDGWILANLTIHNRHTTNSQFIRLDVQNGPWRDFSSARVQSEDTSFVLDVDQKRTASVKFTLTETQYMNIPEGGQIFNITVVATGDDDVSQTIVQVNVLREGSGADTAADESLSWGNIFAFIVGGIVIIALISLLVKIVISTNREEDEIVSLAGYRMQLEETYGSMPAAPDIPGSPPAPLPVTDTVANSAYGGAADIFEQQVTPAPTPPPENTLPAGTPPLPPGGLPEGWTMDQWAHYGDEYRKQQGLD